MFFTGFSADLHSICWYSTSARRGSRAATSISLEQTFGQRSSAELDVRVRRFSDRPAPTQPSSGPQQRRRAEVVEHALLAHRTPRVAYATAVQDQPQRKRCPLFRWHHRG